MPLYEYECDACGERYELIRKFSDPPLDVCPKCGKGPVRKLVSSPAFHLKGSGWYKTDYAPKSSDSEKSGSGKASKSDAADKSASESGDKSASETTAKSDTAAKPADKPAASSPASPGKPEKS